MPAMHLLIEIVGWSGALLILVAYALLSTGRLEGTYETAHNNGDFAWVFPPAGYLNFFSTALCYIGRHTLL